ncbi:hypothetical protein DY000_02024689 [Brassica cretica]|uniref:Uncharacterized protein n=1 Tax=Brassica cretica TaxID=69181 RepID=A0ABQ7E0L2_BRACR|nr:hypothetical protein DY000_02024689 [Brassica cretica]
MSHVLFLLDKKLVPKRQACDDIPHKHTSQDHGPIARTTGLTSSHYAVCDADNAQQESDQSPLFLEAEQSAWFKSSICEVTVVASDEYLRLFGRSSVTSKSKLSSNKFLICLLHQTLKLPCQVEEMAEAVRMARLYGGGD